MRRHHHPVPTTRDVVPGAQVNIVLKADQPTGRTVSGTVRDVLTRGDHPRGIKVRLADGRVGRVQSVGSAELKEASGVAGGAAGKTAETVETASGGGDGNDDGGGPAWGPRQGRRRRTVQGGEEEQEAPPLQVGLDAYIKPAKQKSKGRARKSKGSLAQAGSGEAAGRNTLSQPVEENETVRCPVCSNFEGDAAAVAHHVAGHFDA